MMLDIVSTYQVHESGLVTGLYCRSVEGQMVRHAIFVYEVRQGVSDSPVVGSHYVVWLRKPTFMTVDLRGYVRT